jgi:hypothetical protein
MAYVLEKFSTWTDPDFIALEDGGLEKYGGILETHISISIKTHISIL